MPAVEAEAEAGSEASSGGSFVMVDGVETPVAVPPPAAASPAAAAAARAAWMEANYPGLKGRLVAHLLLLQARRAPLVWRWCWHKAAGAGSL